MDFRILGPLEVRDGDRDIPLGGGRQRALLALLLLHAGEPVATDRLVEELWDDEAPPSAAKAVQNHVSRLRRALQDGRLLTRGSGYELALEPGELDVEQFEELLERGRTALRAGDPAVAAGLLREALALWRGSPLADVSLESSPRSRRSGGSRSDAWSRSRNESRPISPSDGTRTSSASWKRSSRSTHFASGSEVSSCWRSTGPAGKRRRCTPTRRRATHWSRSWASSPARPCSGSIPGCCNRIHRWSSSSRRKSPSVPRPTVDARSAPKRGSSSSAASSCS